MTLRPRHGLLAAGFVVLAATLLWLVAGAFVAAKDRTREYRYLSEALDPLFEPASTVSWLPPERPLTRSLSPTDEALIGRALTQAWRAFTAAQDTGETMLLAEHFSGTAYDRARIASAQAAADGSRMVVLDQTAHPRFHHLDGSIFQLSASATTLRYRLSEEAILQFQLSRDEVTTTLTNETTGWRIFSHERHASTPVTPAKREPLILPRLMGINYYPAQTPWSRFWPEFDPSVIAADLDLVTSLNANALRIFLPPADFADDPAGADNLRKLNDFLRMAEDRDLSVIPTLFDMKSTYRPAHWAEDVAYLRRVLPVLDASPAVVLVDLKNEPDLDHGTAGKPLVDAWLITMIQMTRDIAPALPLTIGWATAEAAPDHAPLLDAISYHDYAPAEGTADRLARVREGARGKPVLVTEIGVSSYTLALRFPGSPASQAGELADRMTALGPADGVFIWTLHDFPAPEARAVGGSPWVRNLQSRFGLYDATGAAKPAAAAVAAAFADATRPD